MQPLLDGRFVWSQVVDVSMQIYRHSIFTQGNVGHTRYIQFSV